ncbi:hypothetical protein Tco_1414372, partial [Tanacetum coccineum]
AKYTQDENFGSLPNVLSNSNFTKDPSKVITIELTVSMIVVNNLESLVTPLPFSGKKKKKKSQTVSQPKPKTHGLEALGSLPQKSKKALTKKTTPQATETPPTKKVPTEDSNKTQDSVLQHPADKGLPFLVHDESIGKPKPLPKGPREDKDLERLKPLADMESLTPPVTFLSGTDVEYEVDQTQSTRFEVLVPNQHQSKTYSEVELDFEPLKLITTADIQALLGTSDDDLKEDSEDDVSEVEEEWMKTFKRLALKIIKHILPLKLLLKNLIHKSIKSSLCSETLKPYDNHMPITKRKLVSNLQNFIEVLYARVAEDTCKKHKYDEPRNNQFLIKEPADPVDWES